MTLGVTGKTCSGKNAVCDFLAREGFSIIDADAIGHALLSDADYRARLVELFGTGILLPCGDVDRKALGERVFSSKAELKKLNSIAYPAIVKRIRASLSLIDKRGGNVAINAALLPYWHIPELTAVIWVKAPFLRRLCRAGRRDKRGLLFSLKRTLSQRELSPKLFPENVDIYTVSNSTDLVDLVDSVRELVAAVAKKAGD